MVDIISQAEEHAHLGGRSRESHVVTQFVQRARVILKAEGVTGLCKRIKGRLRRKPLHLCGYIVALRLDCPIRVPPPAIDVEIDEVEATDEDALEVLTQIDEWRSPKTHLLNRLQQGHRFYAVRYKGQIVGGLWCQDTEFDSDYLRRKFQLAVDEIYFYNAFVTPAFRGKGIVPYLVAECARRIKAHSPYIMRIVALIYVTNKASLRAAAKVGATRIGRVGFIELFGIRLHYILGRDALPATRRRFFFERV